MLHFDTSPVLYWFPCCLLCFGLVWAAFRTQLSNTLVLGLAAIMLLLLRLPTLLYNREINPDESQMITQGRTLAIDPVYFRSVDGTTIGPLDSYVLILPSWIGLPFDYIAARLVGYVLLVGSLVFLFRAAKRWFGSTPARLALLPSVFVLGLTQNSDLLSYCSELVPLLLLSAGISIFAHFDTSSRPVHGRLFLLGILIGAVPLGKLQGAPMAAILGLFSLITLFRQPTSLSSKLTQIALLGLGTIACPLAFIGMAWANGLYDDFWLFYIEGNLRYGGNTAHWDNVMAFSSHLGKSDEFGWLILLTGLLTILSIGRYSLLVNRPVLSAVWAVRLGFIYLMLLAAFYAVTRTGTEFVHYFYFLLGPLFLLLALSGKILLYPPASPAWKLAPLAICGLFLGLIVSKGTFRYLQNAPLNYYPNNEQKGFSTPQPPIVQQIRKYGRENEPLVVWGWRCDYYVSAAMPQGTAENHSERCVFNSPMTPFYQQRYLKNFLRTVPPVFVDAVGKHNAWLTDRKTQGFEIIKPLADFIRTNYQYMGLYNDARLYVRNDRVKAISDKR